MSTAQDILDRLYAGYYERAAPSEEASAHWQPHCDAFLVDLRQMTVQGDGFGLPPKRHVRRSILEWSCILSYFIWLPHRLRIAALVRRGHRITRRMELPFLWGSFRQLCAVELISRYLPKPPERIVVIGDGYGFLSAVLKDLYPDARIVLIDLGKTLLFQVFHLTKAYPAASHVLAGDGDGDFVYCPADQIDRLPFVYDLAVNTHSMQEMTMAIVGRYFRFLRQHCRPDNLFYCCNRESKTLPDGEVIAFGNYPWSGEDVHLVDERPRFYKYFVTGTFPYIATFHGQSRHRLTRLAVPA